jgi:hypothetical protein
MKHAQPYANWSGAPALSHPWMAALLRLAAMLVSSAASIPQMGLSLLARECHTDVQPDALPGGKSGISAKETQPAAANSQSPEGLMLRVRRAAPNVSKHEAGLTGGRCNPSQHAKRKLVSPLIPTKVGTQGGHQDLLRLEAAAPRQNQDHHDPGIPVCAGAKPRH